MNRALVVDDDPSLASVIQHWLADEGFTVDTGNSFEDGRRLLPLGPDLLVTDVRLGGFNGLHLVLLARKAMPALRVLVISGYDDPVIRREVDALGAGFLQKPFTLSDFRSAVDATTALAAPRR